MTLDEKIELAEDEVKECERLIQFERDREQKFTKLLELRQETLRSLEAQKKIVKREPAPTKEKLNG